ncbi:hypothetical protein QFZ43_006492 [Streptomyces afghaniensis]|nr:hypothetical protein [Streptomyces afghaniensis]
MGGVISADDPKWIEPFSGLTESQFTRLVALVRRRGGDVQRGRPWRLPLENRVLLVATYWRTNLTLRQVAPLFGVSKSAADRILDHLAPLLAISPARRPRTPSTSSTAPSCPPATAASPPPARTTATRRTYRSSSTPTAGWSWRSAFRYPAAATTAGHSPSLRRRIPRHRPAHPAPQTTRSDAPQPTPGSEECRPPQGASPGGTRLVARLKNWKILRDCRLKGNGVHQAMLSIARLHNLALTG